MSEAEVYQYAVGRDQNGRHSVRIAILRKCVIGEMTGHFTKVVSMGTSNDTVLSEYRQVP